MSSSILIFFVTQTAKVNVFTHTRRIRTGGTTDITDNTDADNRLSTVDNLTVSVTSV